MQYNIYSFVTMKMPNNTLGSAVSYFKDELNNFFDASEIEQMMYIAFNHFFGINKIDLLTDLNRQFTESELLKIVHTVKDLRTKKPLAYILGEWEFLGFLFKVNKHTLIPRQETEELVQLILDENQGGGALLDIGTGTGCIPISLVKKNPLVKASAYDLSKEALVIANQNASLNSVGVNFEEVNILDKKNTVLSNKFDVIVSNPPYIPNHEKIMMSENVLNYEPHLALFVENEIPLVFYDAISDFALNNLKEGGKLYFEINENFGKDVQRLLMDKGFKNVNIVKDISEKDRIVSCNS